MCQRCDTSLPILSGIVSRAIVLRPHGRDRAGARHLDSPDLIRRRGPSSCRRPRATGSSPGKTPAPGSRARRDSRSSLQPEDRRRLRRLDPPVHPVSRQAPPHRYGGAGDHPLPVFARRGRQRRRLHPEPGVECAAVLVPGRAGGRPPVARRDRARQAPAATARGPDPRRSAGRAAPARGRAAPHGVPALRSRAEAAGVLPLADPGRRLRVEPDRRARRQGGQGPDDDATRRDQAGSRSSSGVRAGAASS